MHHDPMLAKIRKLLAKAEDPAATPAEAEAFTAKAMQLISTYGIDQALLAAEHEDRTTISNRIVVLDRPYAADKADLLATIAIALRCAVVRRTRCPAGVKELSLHLFGYDADLARVDLLYTSLLVQATSALAQVPVPAWQNKAAFRRSWMAGFRLAVGTRLEAAETSAARQADNRRVTGAPSTAVVLVDRSRRVDEAKDREYPDLRRGRRRTLSGRGRTSGYAAGQRADLGGARLGGRQAIRS